MLNCHLPSFSAICYILGYPQCAPKSLIFAFTTLNASPPKADYSHYSSTISSISYLLKVQFIMVTKTIKRTKIECIRKKNQVSIALHFGIKNDVQHFIFSNDFVICHVFSFTFNRGKCIAFLFLIIYLKKFKL